MNIKRIISPFFLAALASVLLFFGQNQGALSNPLLLWPLAFFMIVGCILVDRAINDTPTANDMANHRADLDRARRRRRRSSSSSSSDGRRSSSRSSGGDEQAGDRSRSRGERTRRGATSGAAAAAPLGNDERQQDATAADVAHLPREHGEVKWFNRVKGYGFITRADGSEIFVHYRGIRGEGRQALNDGESVSFVVMDRQKGLQAEDVVSE